LVRAASPTALRFEHWPEAIPALGVGTGAPRLSWITPEAAPDFLQAAYEIEVDGDLGTRSYVVKSPDQVLVPWPAPALGSREAANVRVRVSDGQAWTDWGPAREVEAGLLEATDWIAQAISPVGLGALSMPAPIVAASIDVPHVIRRARLYVTAHGLHVPWINGQRVSEDLLAPGWTSYRRRLRYQTYDVTDLVRPGANELEVLIGNGWFRGRLGFAGARAVYGERLALLAQLEITTTDGGRYVLATDDSWTSRESEILSDDIYDGQATDLRRRMHVADLPSSGVEIVPMDLGLLVAPEGPPVRVAEVVNAERVWSSPSGRTLVDFGQNVVGWVRLRVRHLLPGAQVTVRHAEVLEDGELCLRVLRSAKATDSYWVSGHREEILEPLLTFHGFRYAEVTGIDRLLVEDVEAVVLGSALERTGWFDSTDLQLNRLHENVVWSTRGNFLDVPLDCPQRDERLAWTGDIQAFAPAASFLFDTAGFLGTWLADLAAEQHADGSVPHVIPSISAEDAWSLPAAGWGDAATFVPWAVYQRTGDVSILQRQFGSMRAWVDRVADVAGPDRLWTGGFQFGDWLDPTAPPEQPAAARADPGVVATAFFARSAAVVAQAAETLGYHPEAHAYSALADEIRSAFARAFVSSPGIVRSDAQTVYALAIAWDLLPTEKDREAAGRRLADLVRSGGFRIGTGFLGTPLVCDALSLTGHADVAYRLLLQTGCPSWLYPVTMGATTIWERWDGIRPDGSINPGEMNSFNHYALGAVADWMHRTVAGLAPLEPGYRAILVHPIPSPSLSGASASHRTPYGDARVSWERRDGRFSLRVRIPVGSTAQVHVPGAEVVQLVRHGEHLWVVADPVAIPQAREAGSTVRDVLDDAATWARVTAAVVDAGVVPGGEVEAAGMLAAFLDAPADVVATVLAPDARSPEATAARTAVSALLNPVTDRPA
jgi:alpha-L-rhamnosidase